MKQLNNEKAPQAISGDIVIQNIGSELLVYNLKTHRAMSLNTTVACIWELCDGKNSLSLIREQTEKKLKASIPEEAITLALIELSKNDLLITDTLETGAKDSLSDMSRRAMIRKIGMTTAVAIPVVMAITAPKAVHAASGGQTLLPNGASCANDLECQSDCCLGGVQCQPIDSCF